MTKKNLEFKDGDFLENIEFLILINDVFQGTKQIKRKGAEYLHTFTLENEDKYRERLKNSIFKNFLTPAINNLNSLIFRKGIKLSYDEKYENFFKNVDGEGSSLELFMQNVSKKAIRDGLTYVWVDSAKINDSAVNKNDTIYPFFKQIDRANVFSKKITVENGIKKLSQIVIVQEIDLEVESIIVKKDLIFFVLDINGGKVYQKSKNYAQIDQWENNLGYIPVFPVYSAKSGFLESDIPFFDLANVNLHHYNKTSDLDYILHMTATPIISLFNYQSDGKDKLKIGPNSALLFEDKQSSGVEISEIQGTSIDKLQNHIQNLEDFMDKMSLNILSQKSFGTATEAKISDKNSGLFLVEISKSLEDTFNKCLLIAEVFSGDDYNFKLELYKDYSDIALDANTIDKLIALKRDNMISLETLWSNLIKGEILENFDFELEKQKIQDDNSQI